MTQRKHIPVLFIACPAAVNEAGLLAMLSLDDGRPIKAAKRSAWEFRRAHGIKKLPGGVFPVKQIESAVASEAMARQGCRRAMERTK